ILGVICRKQIPWVSCCGPEVKAKNWEAYVSQSRGKRTPEEYNCCREDGTPCCSKQQSRQRRQRRTKNGLLLCKRLKGGRREKGRRGEGQRGSV
ncbi:unnamed protein product, partial [Bubo scandiacus]